jgi:hypothetical protein
MPTTSLDVLMPSSPLIFFCFFALASKATAQQHATRSGRTALLTAAAGLLCLSF